MPRITDVLAASAVRVLLIYAAAFGFLVLYGRTHFYRDPGSVFFDKAHAYEEFYTRHRRHEVQEFIRKQDALSLNPNLIATYSGGGGQGANDVPSNITKASRNPQVCVSFLTVRRKSEQYVEEAIGSALLGLSPEERRNMHVGVFFAHTDLDEHPSYHKGWIHDLVDSVYSYDLPPEQLAQVASMEQDQRVQEKSIFDYNYALKWCYHTGAPYALILEGDVVLAESWFVQILSALQHARDELHLTTSDWLYLRLFNQERSTGWAGRRVGDHHELAISAGIVLVILCVKVAANRLFPKHNPLTNPLVLVICCIIVPATVVMFFQAGKASILPPRAGVKVESFGCCSQALLYPREQITPLMMYLNDEGPDQYDLMINRHAADAGLRRLTLYPVLVQHIGVDSVHTSGDEARSVWSTAFESLDAARLRNQHHNLVSQLFNSTDPAI